MRLCGASKVMRPSLMRLASSVAMARVGPQASVVAFVLKMFTWCHLMPFDGCLGETYRIPGYLQSSYPMMPYDFKAQARFKYT